MHCYCARAMEPRCHNGVMADADPAYVVPTAPLADDLLSVGAWTEVSRVRSEPDAVKLAATLRSNDAVARVLRANDFDDALFPIN